MGNVSSPPEPSSNPKIKVSRVQPFGRLSKIIPFPHSASSKNNAGGEYLITDTQNHCIWKWTERTEKFECYAGICGKVGNTDGMISDCSFGEPSAIAVSAVNNHNS